MKILIDSFWTLGGIYLMLFFLSPIIIFILWHLSASFILKSRENFKQDAFVIGRFSAVLLVFILTFTGCLFLLGIFNKSIPTDEIIRASDLCSAADRTIFGTDVPFWLQNQNNPWKNFLDAIGPIAVWAYNALNVFIFFTMSITLLSSFYIFLRFITSFSLVVMISMPIWFALPAIPPVERYLDNIYNAPIIQPTAQSVHNYQPNSALIKVFKDMRAAFHNNSQGVSTMPSMHVAWSILIVYYLFRLWRPTLFFSIPYALINIFSTIYILEHYAVDIFGGIIVSIIAILISDKLIPIKSKKKNFTDILHEDFRTFISLVKQIDFKKIKR